MPIVDASFLIGLLDENDQWHGRARDASRALMRRLPWRIHALALGEALTVIGSRHGGKAARRAYEMVHDTAELLLPSREDLAGAVDRQVSYDGTISLSDAMSLHYADVTGDREVLSFDADFDGKGVVRLPK